jgi:hypothetical protein
MVSVMKAEQLTDTTIQEPKSEIVIELPNGQRLSCQGYYHASNTRNEKITVLKTGRILGKKQHRCKLNMTFK